MAPNQHVTITADGQNDNERRRHSSIVNQASSRQSRSNASRKSGVGGKDLKGKDSRKIKLPTCPEGQILTANLNPCERPIGGRNRPRRKQGFRVPLKKEDGNMEAQIIEYNCEFPNRVVVRLEYLMQSTKVRLNDRTYMDDFYQKLLEEETLALEKSIRLRERAEQTRMKKLIIDGINKNIPPELSYLNKHPVFRVNQMLSRLKEHEKYMHHKPAGEEDITPVEPYEYNGNQFFQYLHETGDLWVPPEQEQFDEKKMEGKIYRAKLRLLQKRKEEEAEQKILRIMNNVAATQQKKAKEAAEREMVGGEEGDVIPPPPSAARKTEKKPSWELDFMKEKQKTDTEDAKLNEALKMQFLSKDTRSTAEMAVDEIKAKLQKDVHRLHDRIRTSKEKEKELENILELKRYEQEINFLDTFNYEKARIIQKFDKRQKHGQVNDLFDRPDHKPRKHTDQTGQTGKPKPYEKLFEDESVDSDEARNNRKSRFIGEPLFEKLQKVYAVKTTFPFHHYEPYDNDLILNYLDNAENGKEMIDCGTQIADMYTRQLMAANDYLRNSLQKARSKLQD